MAEVRRYEIREVTSPAEPFSGPVKQVLIDQRDVEPLVALLRDLTEHETEPCRFDHHGYCQEHGWFDTDPPCPIPRARALLSAFSDQPSGERGE